MLDFTVLSATLNKVIMPAIIRQQYHRAPAWQLVGGWSAEENVAKRANVHVDRFENNQMYIPLRQSYHSGIVSIAAGEKYQYGQYTLQTSYSTIKTLVGSFQIQKGVLNTTNKGAIVKPLVYSTEALSRDLAMDANRQVYGNNSGVIATTASSGSSSTTVALTASTNGDMDYARYFPPKTYIQIGSNAVTQVVSQNSDNQITIADAQSWSASANIVKVTGSNTTSSEMDGFAGMIAASGSYQNLDSSTMYNWKSSVDSTAETLVTTAGNALEIKKKIGLSYFKANKVGKVDWIVMNSSLYQLYGNSLTGIIRFDQKEVLSGGWVGLDYMGGHAKILLDYDCPDDRIYMLSTEDIVYGQFQPLEWEKGTDGVLFKITQQLDYEVTASWMGNMGTLNRGSFALLSNKTAGS